MLQIGRFESSANSTFFRAEASCARAAAAYDRSRSSSPGAGKGARLGKRSEVTCMDCLFHKAGLCALMLESPCPTFRSTERGVLVPPLQPRLVPRPVSAFAHRHAA